MTGNSYLARKLPSKGGDCASGLPMAPNGLFTVMPGNGLDSSWLLFQAAAPVIVKPRTTSQVSCVSTPLTR